MTKSNWKKQYRLERIHARHATRTPRISRWAAWGERMAMLRQILVEVDAKINATDTALENGRVSA